MPHSGRSSTSWQGREMADIRSAWARTSGRPGAQTMRPVLNEVGSERAHRIQDPLGIAAGASTRSESTGTRTRTSNRGHSGCQNLSREKVLLKDISWLWCQDAAKTLAGTRSGRPGVSVQTLKRFVWDPVVTLPRSCRLSRMRWAQQDFTVEQASWQLRGQGRDMGKKASWSSPGAPSLR